jgi:hypothetical protein
VGAWGPGSFDNDDALDWLAELTEGSSLGPVNTAFALVQEADYLEAPDAAAAVAAAEIVAALMGRPPADLPEEAAEWVQAHPSTPGATLVARARGSVIRVREDSELKELWEEGDAGEWHASMDELAARLLG